MVDTPLVTVAITACERAELFRICLRSVCEQTYRNLEIFVFDNSTSDDVRTCVEERADNRVVYKRNPANIRDVIAINHNKAFVPRSGQYHIVLSSDFAFAPEAIELMVNALRADPLICAVTADECSIEPSNGSRQSSERKYENYEIETTATHVRLDAWRMIQDAFFRLTSVCVGYHSLIVSDVLGEGGMERLYLSQASEHQLGLELLLQKSRIGIIRKELLHELVNNQRYRPPDFRKYRRYAKTAARYEFLERNYLELLSKGFNITLLRVGVAWLFAIGMFRVHERPFYSAFHFSRIAIPGLLALCLLPICLVLDLLFGVARYILQVFKIASHA